MSLRPWVVVAAAFWLAGPSGAEAQEGRIVARIEIVGARRVSRDAVLARLKTRVGEPFRAAALREDIKTLTGEGGFFLSMEVDSVVLPDGKLALFFRVQEKDFVEQVVIQGVEAQALREVKRVLDLEVGRFVTRYDLNLRARRLEDWYYRKGHAWAQVRVTSEKGTRGGVQVRVQVDEGPAVAVERVVFRGLKELTAAELEGVLQTRAATFLRAGRFDREILAADRVRLEEYCRERGFKDAQVQLVDLLWSEDLTRVTPVFWVEEGPAYTVAAIRFEGNRLFSAAELRALLQQKVGERYDGEKILGDIRAVRRRYMEAAYLDVTFKDRFRGVPGPKLVYDARAPRVTLIYRIEEGRRTRIGAIKIEGNELTRDKVILRELTVGPGDWADIREVERSLARLRGLGYFEVGGVEGPFWEPTEEPGVKNMILRLKEGRTGSIQVGIGIGADAGFFGQFRLLKENFDLTDWPRSLGDVFRGRAFTGAGETLLLSAAPGTRFSVYQLVFTEPAFLDTPWIFSLNLFSRRERFVAIDNDQAGVEVGFGRRLDRDLGLRDRFTTRTTLRYTVVESGERDPVDLTVPPTPLRVPTRMRFQGIRQTARYASWDDPLLHGRGFELNLAGDLTGGPFGGTESFVRAEATAEVGLPLYEPAPRRIHVLGWRGRFGWAEEFGSSRFVPLVERFYLGGGTWLRGFDFQGVGPRDQRGDPLGGQAVWAASLEYRFPLYGEFLRGVLFYDAGSLAERIGDGDLGRVRMSVGFGFRIIFPFLGPVPFVLDFGFPIRREPGDERRLVSFSLSRLFF